MERAQVWYSAKVRSWTHRCWSYMTCSISVQLPVCSRQLGLIQGVTWCKFTLSCHIRLMKKIPKTTSEEKVYILFCNLVSYRRPYLVWIVDIRPQKQHTLFSCLTPSMFLIHLSCVVQLSSVYFFHTTNGLVFIHWCTRMCKSKTNEQF